MSLNSYSNFPKWHYLSYFIDEKPSSVKRSNLFKATCPWVTQTWTWILGFPLMLPSYILFTYGALTAWQELGRGPYLHYLNPYQSLVKWGFSFLLSVWGRGLREEESARDLSIEKCSRYLKRVFSSLVNYTVTTWKLCTVVFHCGFWKGPFPMWGTLLSSTPDGSLRTNNPLCPFRFSFGKHL